MIKQKKSETVHLKNQTSVKMPTASTHFATYINYSAASFTSHATLYSPKQQFNNSESLYFQ